MFFRTVYKSGQIFLPFCHNSRVWHTDRQTDGRTDRILIARPRLHCMQRGKNKLNKYGVKSAHLDGKANVLCLGYTLLSPLVCEQSPAWFRCCVLWTKPPPAKVQRRLKYDVNVEDDNHYTREQLAADTHATSGNSDTIWRRRGVRTWTPAQRYGVCGGRWSTTANCRDDTAHCHGVAWVSLNAHHPQLPARTP